MGIVAGIAATIRMQQLWFQKERDASLMSIVRAVWSVQATGAVRHKVTERAGMAMVKIMVGF